MTLGQLAVTVAVLAALGLATSRFGLSAIPAYILAGILLGPNDPEIFSLIDPSEVTEFVAELGVIFLLFFLGIEFSLNRLLESGRHLVLGGSIDLVVNATFGLAVGLLMFGPGFAAILVGAAVYISSSAVTVKGLIECENGPTVPTSLWLFGSAIDRSGERRPARYTARPSRP